MRRSVRAHKHYVTLATRSVRAHKHYVTLATVEAEGLRASDHAMTCFAQESLRKSVLSGVVKVMCLTFSENDHVSSADCQRFKALIVRDLRKLQT